MSDQKFVTTGTGKNRGLPKHCALYVENTYFNLKDNVKEKIAACKKHSHLCNKNLRKNDLKLFYFVYIDNDMKASGLYKMVLSVSLDLLVCAI